jgi:hypothetical protein
VPKLGQRPTRLRFSRRSRASNPRRGGVSGGTRIPNPASSLVSRDDANGHPSPPLASASRRPRDARDRPRGVSRRVRCDAAAIRGAVGDALSGSRRGRGSRVETARGASR